jgi:hypothetical protein
VEKRYGRRRLQREMIETAKAGAITMASKEQERKRERENVGRENIKNHAFLYILYVHSIFSTSLPWQK